MDYFKRKFKLVIGDHVITNVDKDSYRINFNIVKKVSEGWAQGDITIWNPHHDIMKSIKYGTPISLDVGYEIPEPIFSGQITSPQYVWNGTDREYKLAVTNIRGSYNQAQPSITKVSKPTPIIEVLEDLAADLKVALVVKDRAEFNKMQLQKTSFSGNVRETLTLLKRKFQFEYFADSENLTVFKLGVLIKASESSTDVSLSTGMLGVPEVGYSGIIARTLINPSIECGAVITIKSPAWVYQGESDIPSLVGFQQSDFGTLLNPDISGSAEKFIESFRSHEVTHMGDTHNDLWETNIVGIRQGRGKIEQ